MTQEKGLYQKYVVTKADGLPVDPNAVYFVLRLDTKDFYGYASRNAIRLYAKLIKRINPQLASDITDSLFKIWKEKYGIRL
jgi:hypothetical protein